MNTGSTYPFPPRPGSNTESSRLNFEVMDQPSGLNAEELATVLEFEQNLYDASLEPSDSPKAVALAEERGGIQPIESVWKKRSSTTSLGVEYFTTEEGRDALEVATGVQLTADDPGQIKGQLYRLDISGIDSKVLDKLEADSVGHEEKSITDHFIENGFDGEGITTPDIITIFKDPSVIADRVEAYKALKSYVKAAGQDVEDNAGNESDAIVAAKTLVLGIYRQKLNRLLASNYVNAYKLLHQHNNGDNIHAESVDRLDAALPAYLKGQDADFIARFLQRIDRFQHGVSRRDDGSLTWLSPEAAALVDGQETTGNEAVIDRGEYADIDPDDLETFEIDGETLGEWLRDVLKEYELLSEETEWDSDRTHRPADNKWQIIVNDKFKSLSVNDKQGAVKVPHKSMNLLKAISLSNHEITHVLQHENKRAIGHLALMEKLGLDSVSEQTESGGKWQERVAYEALTGKPRDVIAGTGYFAMLSIKEKGGSFGDAVKAYYEDLLAGTPSMKPETAASQAVNRARRIYRAGGTEYAADSNILTNTQPLSYLEQQLIYESLSEEQRQFLFIGGVSLRNLVELSAAGLVKIDEISIPDKMPWQLLHDKAAKVIAQGKSSSGAGN